MGEGWGQEGGEGGWGVGSGWRQLWIQLPPTDISSTIVNFWSPPGVGEGGVEEGSPGVGRERLGRSA